jgi:hypothetical protein
VRGGGLSGKDAWSYAMRRGARNVYHNREQWSYALRNSQNIPMGEVERLQRQLEEQAPSAALRPNLHGADNEYTAEREEIVDAMARTFFVSAWADAMEEAGQRLQGELMDQAPATPPEAHEFAEKAAKRIEESNRQSLPELYERMANFGHANDHSREPSAFEFGYSLAMMYMGSGVSWFDDHPTDGIFVVPHGEGMYIELEEGDYEENARGGPRGEVDEHAATELVQFIENTSELSIDGPMGQGKSILLNLMRKWRKGNYDFELSVKLFEYLAETGAKAYANEYHEQRGWSSLFNVPTRKAAAREMAESFRSRAEGGEFDGLDTKMRR